MALNLTDSINISSDKDIDNKYRVADNTERDLLITNQKCKIGHTIYHETDNKRYSLTAYPTFGNLTGVVWSAAGLSDIPADTMLANTIAAGLNPPIAKTTTEIRTLLNVADGAQVNRSNAQLKIDYESNADTNAYTDSEKTTLGFVSVTQAVDLDTIESDTAINNAKVTNVSTNLAYSSTTGIVSSSDGTDATIVLASGTNRGLMLGVDKTKLDGIEAGATNNIGGTEVIGDSLLSTDTVRPGSPSSSVLLGNGAGLNASAQRFTAIGRRAGTSTRGEDNTLIGNDALRYSTDAGNADTLNTVVGSEAGANFSPSFGDNITLSSLSTFIGARTRGHGSTVNNTTVIGFSAISSGDNTVTIGNNAIVGTYLKGDTTTTGSFIMTNLTTVERLALTPSNGMVVYDTTENELYKYENTTWSKLAITPHIQLEGDTTKSNNAGPASDGGSPSSSYTSSIAIGKRVSMVGQSSVRIGNMISVAGGGVGQRNVNIGDKAGETISSGIVNTNSVLIGYEACTEDGIGGVISGAEKSVFIGAFAKVQTGGNNITNQTVIGYDAESNGDNTATLGNDNVTDTYLKGNVIGATDGAFIVNNVTTATKNTFSTNGSIIYDTDLAEFQMYEDGVWKDFTSKATLSKLQDKAETIYIDGTVTTFEIPFNGQINSEVFIGDFANEIARLDITVRVGGSTSYDTTGLNIYTTDGSSFTNNGGTSPTLTAYSIANSSGQKYLVVTVTKKAAWTYQTSYKFNYKQL